MYGFGPQATALGERVVGVVIQYLFKALIILPISLPWIKLSLPFKG